MNIVLLHMLKSSFVGNSTVVIIFGSNLIALLLMTVMHCSFLLFINLACGLRLLVPSAADNEAAGIPPAQSLEVRCRDRYCSWKEP